MMDDIILNGINYVIVKEEATILLVVWIALIGHYTCAEECRNY